MDKFFNKLRSTNIEAIKMIYTVAFREHLISNSFDERIDYSSMICGYDNADCGDTSAGDCHCADCDCDCDCDSDE